MAVAPRLTGRSAPWGSASSDCFSCSINIAIGFTTVARASLALATLPRHTMVVGFAGIWIATTGGKA
jgi:hypothetical protein